MQTLEKYGGERVIEKVNVIKAITIVSIIIVISVFGYLWYKDKNPELRETSYIHYAPLVSDKIVCIYFDDGWKSQLNVVSILDEYQYKPTLSIIVDVITGNHPKYLTLDQLKSLSDKGYDIQSHSYSHAKLTSLSQIALEKEIVGSKEYLISCGFSVSTFIYPFGEGYNNATIKQLVEKNYSTARTSIDGVWNTLFGDKYVISGFGMRNDTSFQQFENWVSKANGTSIVILIYHQFDNNQPEEYYSVTSEDFEQQMRYLYDNGFKVKLLNEVI